MSKKDSKLTAIMLVQQLEEDYWGSLDYKKPIEEAKNGNCTPLIKMVVKKLEDADITVKEAYIIKHDKDIVTIWDSEKLENTLVKKNEHVHILLKFEKGSTLNNIALKAKVDKQYFEKLKSGRYGYDNCLAYLVHAKDENKYQYKPEEVFTLRGEDYVNIYHRTMETWMKGRAIKKVEETKQEVDWLVEQILSGEVTKSNIMLTDAYFTIYGQHKRRINEALASVGERKSYKTIAELEAGKFKKTIIFINAESGVGKTRYSKKLINLLQRIALKYGQTWDSCVTASTNAFDEYNGQNILFLDDIRGESLTVSDWLKLLDPYTISPISARYNNKMGSAQVIIITSTKKPIEFFEGAKGNFGEDLGQFIRRIDYLLTIDDNFNLSTPEKSSTIPIQSTTYWYSEPPRFHSFSFSKAKKYAENKATDIIIKTVIKNMQWKTKKVIDDSDQTKQR